MRRIIAGLVLGLVAGLILGLAAPSEAGSWLAWSRRVDSRLASLEGKMRQLDYKMRQLDYSGNYTGNIDADQINNALFCGYNDVVLWEFRGIGC